VFTMETFIVLNADLMLLILLESIIYMKIN
jgi:hypothetical protein